MKTIIAVALMLYLLAAITSTGDATPVQGPLPDIIRQLPDLESLTFHEWSVINDIERVTPVTYGKNRAELTTRLPDPLVLFNSDINGNPSPEHYDVFYSDADGSLNPDGRYLTIECARNVDSGGGGLNIARVDLNFAGGSTEHFNLVQSFVALGSNAQPESVGNAVDGDLQTHTVMGNTAGQAARLRLTLGFIQGCAYSLQPSSQSFPGDGGTGTFRIIAPSGCDWIVLASTSGPSVPFIHITSAGAGAGNGTVSFTVQPNIGPDPRTGFITLNPTSSNPQTFRVHQQGNTCPASAYTLTPTHYVQDDEDGAVIFTVDHPAGCAVSASSNVSWLTELGVTPTATFTTFTYSIAKNNGPWRTGTITAGGKQLTVYQNSGFCPAEAVCAFFGEACAPIGGTLTIARSFRDEVLAQSPRGQRYTRLYYHFSSEAVQSMMLNPMLILRSREMMDRYKPVLASMVKGEPVALTSGDLDEIDRFLNSFGAKGSPAFQEAIKELCEELRDPRIHREFNITLMEGPSRESPSKGQFQGLLKTGGLFLGFGAIFAFGLTGRRRKFLVRHARPLLVLALALSVLTGMLVLPAATVSSAKVSAGNPASTPAQLSPSSLQLSNYSYLGGSGADEGTSIAVDSAGNTYIVGLTDSLDFPILNAAQANFGGGQQDAFVAKFNPAGSLIYSTYIGGDGQDNATSIAVDAQGNAYITGFTTSTNFPTRNPLQSSLNGLFNAFVTRLDPAGSLVYSTYLGGSLGDHGSSIAIDSSGRIYVAGITSSPDFPLSNPIQSEFGGASDVFVARLNASGNRLTYSTYLGGAGMDGASSLAVDSFGNAYLTGVTSSPDFPTENPMQERLSGFFDAFVVKVHSSGNRLVYSTYLGGEGEDRALRISVDNAGNAYVTGDTDSADFPVVNAAQAVIGGSADAFITKINPSGSALVYSTYLGGSGIDGGAGVAVDGAGRASVSGFTASEDFQLVAAFQTALGGGGYDGFVARLSPTGEEIDYATYLGGSGVDSAFGVATDSGGNVHVMGVTDSTDLATANPFQQSYGGGVVDLFMARLRLGLTITDVIIKGKHVIITGSEFERGAVILLDGVAQKTKFKSATSLKGKKVGQKIAPGETVQLQVRNPDGATSSEISFTRAAQ